MFQSEKKNINGINIVEKLFSENGDKLLPDQDFKNQ